MMMIMTMMMMMMMIIIIIIIIQFSFIKVLAQRHKGHLQKKQKIITTQTTHNIFKQYKKQLMFVKLKVSIKPEFS